MNSKFLWLDKLGMCTSMVCAVHCLSVPLLFIFGFDSLLNIVDQEWVEVGIVVFAFCIGVIAFIQGFLRHRQHFVSVLFLAGFLLLLNGESVIQPWLGTLLSVFGALIIVYAHFNNLRWQSR